MENFDIFYSISTPNLCPHVVNWTFSLRGNVHSQFVPTTLNIHMQIHRMDTILILLSISCQSTRVVATTKTQKCPLSQNMHDTIVVVTMTMEVTIVTKLTFMRSSSSWITLLSSSCMRCWGLATTDLHTGVL